MTYRSYRNLFFLILAITTGLMINQRREATLAKQRQVSTLTAQQVIAQTSRLSRAILPHSGTLQLTAVPIDANKRWWQVDCTDENNCQQAEFFWRADTGKPFRILIARHATQGQMMARQQAQHRSWYWIQTLGWAQEARRWKIITTFSSLHGLWTFAWSAPGHHVNTEIDARTGALFLATDSSDLDELKGRLP